MVNLKKKGKSRNNLLSRNLIPLHYPITEKKRKIVLFYSLFCSFPHRISYITFYFMYLQFLGNETNVYKFFMIYCRKSENFTRLSRFFSRFPSKCLDFFLSRLFYYVNLSKNLYFFEDFCKISLGYLKWIFFVINLIEIGQKLCHRIKKDFQIDYFMLWHTLESQFIRMTTKSSIQFQVYNCKIGGKIRKNTS